MDLGNTILNIANDNLKDDSYFIVDVIVKGVSGKTKILVLLDGDEGVNIDECANLSRKIGLHIETEELMDTPFILEVSSPGLDHPLKLERQYKKNIGRELKLMTKSGDTHKGKLLQVSDSSVELDSEVKENKKVSFHRVTVPFKEVEKANVLVSFK